MSCFLPASSVYRSTSQSRRFREYETTGEDPEHWKKFRALVQKKCTENTVQREYIVSVLILCGLHKALYKIPQKTGTELPYSLEYRMSGQIVDQKCSVLFLCFFLAVKEGNPSLSA